MWTHFHGAMFKRILILTAAAVMGRITAACMASMRLAASWSLLPSRELDKSASYVREVMKTVNENYVDPNGASYDSLTKLSLHGMVDSLDPHSEYLESKDNQELEEDLDGEYGGIGVEVEMHHGAFSVISPIPGSPGDRAGIRLGDEILSIDGKPVDHSVPMDNIVDQLRGKPHTHVKVGLLRPSDGRRLDLDLVREVIKVESVRGARVIDGGTGYIQIAGLFRPHRRAVRRRPERSPRRRASTASSSTFGTTPAASWTPRWRWRSPSSRRAT